MLLASDSSSRSHEGCHGSCDDADVLQGFIDGYDDRGEFSSPKSRSYLRGWCLGMIEGTRAERTVVRRLKVA